MIDDYMSPDFRPIVHLMPILGHIFRFRWDLWVFAYVAWSMIDDFMSPDFRPVVHPMPHRGIFSFWVRFTDLRGGHVLDDRWFHDICPSDLSRTWCHTGAYFLFDWDLRIFIELHAHPHLRDTHWHDVSFVEHLGSYPVRLAPRDTSMSSCFPSERRPFDLYVFFSCTRGWLGSRIRWRVI